MNTPFTASRRMLPSPPQSATISIPPSFIRPSKKPIPSPLVLPSADPPRYSSHLTAYPTAKDSPSSLESLDLQVQFTAASDFLPGRRFRDRDTRHEEEYLPQLEETKPLRITSRSNFVDKAKRSSACLPDLIWDDSTTPISASSWDEDQEHERQQDSGADVHVVEPFFFRRQASEQLTSKAKSLAPQEYYHYPLSHNQIRHSKSTSMSSTVVSSTDAVDMNDYPEFTPSIHSPKPLKSPKSPISPRNQEPKVNTTVKVDTTPTVSPSTCECGCASLPALLSRLSALEHRTSWMESELQRSRKRDAGVPISRDPGGLPSPELSIATRLVSSPPLSPLTFDRNRKLVLSSAESEYDFTRLWVQVAEANGKTKPDSSLYYGTTGGNVNNNNELHETPQMGSYWSDDESEEDDADTINDREAMKRIVSSVYERRSDEMHTPEGVLISPIELPDDAHPSQFQPVRGSFETPNDVCRVHSYDSAQSNPSGDDRSWGKKTKGVVKMKSLKKLRSFYREHTGAKKEESEGIAVNGKGLEFLAL